MTREVVLQAEVLMPEEVRRSKRILCLSSFLLRQRLFRYRIPAGQYSLALRLKHLNPWRIPVELGCAC